MAVSKTRVAGVAAVLALGWCLALPAGASAVVLPKGPEAKIVGLPAITCDPAKNSFVIDGGNLSMCGGKSTMVGNGWSNYAWPAAVNKSYYYVSAKKGEDGSEKIATFPSIALGGMYEVWASYRGSENRSPAAPFYVYTDRMLGTDKVTYKVVVNQSEPGGGNFFSVKLGTFAFLPHKLDETPRTTGIVACVNEGRGSSESIDAIFYVYKGPMSPNGLKASDGAAADKITLSWLTIPKMKAYRIYRNTTNRLVGAKAITTVPASTSTKTRQGFIDRGLEAGKTYYYWVRTIDASGKLSPFIAPDKGSTATP